MIRLVQLKYPKDGRRVAEAALATSISLAKKISALRSRESLDYDAVYSGKSKWRLLPAFDHPDEPARCLVTGTGLTHRKSAENRQAMHTAQTGAVTDSMRMYQWGIEGGRPEHG